MQVHAFTWIPVALGRISLVTLAMTITSKGTRCSLPANANVTVKNPLDSRVEYLDWLNPMQEAKIRLNYNTYIITATAVIVYYQQYMHVRCDGYNQL